MKILHLSDLHLGKRVNEFSFLEDQEYIFNKIIDVIKGEKPDFLIIAGDIYDKSMPGTEAVGLFDRFLTEVAAQKVRVLAVSGNHDAPERVAFGASLMEKGGVFLSRVYDGRISPLVFADGYGETAFYLLPFLRPSQIRRFYPEAASDTFSEAFRRVISDMKPDPARRNVLIAHQFVVGAQLSDSEDIAAGGLDALEASLFDAFDYVALGHIHRPQNIGRETLRYCGTPLQYSFSEKDQEKSVTCAELFEKGTVRVRTIPLKPLRRMVELRGSFAELMAAEHENREDYFRIVLTDEEELPDAVPRLRGIYPNIMQLVYDNTRTRNSETLIRLEEMEKKTETELYAELYEKQNGREMSGEQLKYMTELFQRIREKEV